MMTSKKLRTILYLLIFAVLSVRSLYEQSANIGSLGFDDQNLFLWQFTERLGLVPYKDIFYPYGILSYFLQSQLIFKVLFVIIVFSLFVALNYILRQMFQSSVYQDIVMILFLLFLVINGTQAFARYGIFTVYSFLLGLLFYNRDLFQKKYLFLFGALTGFSLLLFIDQGLYLLCVSVLMIFCLHVVHRRVAIREVFRFTVSMLLYFLGLVFTLLFCYLYLISKGSLEAYISNFQQFASISLYAKTPYLHSLRSTYPILNFTVLYLSIAGVSGLLFFRQKLNLLYVEIIMGTVVLFILEQKSIIRSIDNQLVFISIFLVSYWIYYCFPTVRKIHFRKQTLFIASLQSILFLYLLASSANTYSQANSLDRRISLPNNPKFQQIVAVLSEEKKEGKHVFSYPGDPILYYYFHQKPPYYFTTYEATPLFAQKKVLSYVRDYDVDYVVINLESSSIMDEVPHYLRSKEELKYLLTHFTFWKKVNNFLVLKKADQKDFFANVPNDSFIRNYFLRLDFGNIPRSEGLYKTKQLNTNMQVLLKNTSISDVNAYLAREHLSSDDTVFLIRSSSGPDKTQVVFHTQNNIDTSVSFNTCRITVCILDLTSMPLFYTSNTIRSVSINKEFQGTVSIVKMKKSGYFW